MIFILWFVLLPLLCAFLAKRYNRNPAHWLVSGFIFGAFALVALIIKGSLEIGVKCPRCIGDVVQEAKACKHCGANLTGLAQVNSKPKASFVTRIAKASVLSFVALLIFGAIFGKSNKNAAPTSAMQAKLVEPEPLKQVPPVSPKERGYYDHLEFYRAWKIGALGDGKKHWVLSRTNSGGTMLEPITDDSSIARDHRFTIEDQALKGKEKRSQLYDNRGKPGCFQLIMLNGWWTITDYQQGSCDGIKAVAH